MLHNSNTLHRTVILCISTIIILLAGCGERNTEALALIPPTSISITPTLVTLAKGETVNLAAMGNYPDGTSTDITHLVAWTSENPATASVNASTSTMTGLAIGSTGISATLNGVTSPTTNVKVTAPLLVSISLEPPPAPIALGSTTTFIVTGSYSDNSTSDITRLVTWKSGNTAIAKINRAGIATGTGVGQTSILAKLHDITSNPATLTVAFSVGGTVRGLNAGNSITLSNNEKDQLMLAADGSFSFPSAMAKGSVYSLSIAAIPANQPCTHTYGAGIVQSTNVTSLNVICGLPPQGMMVKTANLNAARRDHTITMLSNGKALTTGGVGETDNLASAELYDPSAERWDATGALVIARRNHTATLLPNGKVLAVGGLDTSFARLASAELYDMVTQRWTATGNLASARSQHTATLLPDGKVLVTGGVGMLGSGTLSSAELYEPATGRWTVTGSMAGARSQHTAILLPNGKVLVSGGVGSAKAGKLASAELYDSSTGRWTSTGNLTTARAQHTITLLPNGQVLVAGGIGMASNLSSAELYDPSTGHWKETGSLNARRFLHTALLLPTGNVLVTGGVGETGNLSSAELYQPDTGRWTETGRLISARSQHTAALLVNGKMLVAGGNGTGVLADAELYW